jgi:hypothetical protein
MKRYLTRDRRAVTAALMAPLAAAAIRLPFRPSWPDTNVALLLVVGVAVSQLAAHARRLKVITITDAGYLAQIRETASLAQTGRPAGNVADHVRAQLVVLLDLAGCRFEYGSLLGHPPRLERDGTVLAGHQRYDAGRSGEALRGGRAADVRQRRPVHAHAEAGSRPSLQARLVAITLGDQAGRAFSGEALSRSVR